MAFENPVLDDMLIHVKGYEQARVIEVNNRYGWFKVRFVFSGKTKIYSMNSYGENTMFYRLTAEQRADLYLKLENMGLTEYWRE